MTRPSVWLRSSSTATGAVGLAKGSPSTEPAARVTASSTRSAVDRTSTGPSAASERTRPPQRGRDPHAPFTGCRSMVLGSR